MEAADLTACDLADVLPRSQVVDRQISPLYTPIPRILGPAYTVHCPPGDNLMMHAAIYDAPAGAVIVARSEDGLSAMVGGNVCAMAQQRGIAGMVIDGVARDLNEIRDLRFPVFSRGLCPKPAVKKKAGASTPKIVCGGVEVSSDDLVLADEEGIVVVPSSSAEQLVKDAIKKAEKAASTPLKAWSENHQRVIREALKAAK
ncbi:MAG: RraA family protein [Pseudomonadota bacterium]